MSSTAQTTLAAHLLLRFFSDFGGPIPIQLLDAFIIYARKLPVIEHDRLATADHALDRMQLELFLDDLVEFLRPLGRCVVRALVVG